MVLLGDIIQLQQTHSNLSTCIPTLDNILHHNQVKNRIYDLQSSSSCNGMYTIMGSLISSHLNDGKPVLIIDTLTKFPFYFIKQQPDFKPTWLLNITHYKLDSFAKVYGFFIRCKLEPNTMVIINEFHELLKMYKLELSSVYEDMILKHHIDMNTTFLENKKSPDKEPTPIPQLPQNSDLLKSSPVIKYEAHVASLIANLKNKCINDNALIFLLGYLDTKYRPYKSRSQDLVESTTFLSVTEKGRVVLSPFKIHKSLDDLKIIFYHDWYHNSPQFRKSHRLHFAMPGKPPSYTIEKYQLKLVYVAEVFVGQKHLQPVYFDTESEFYHQGSTEGFDGSYSLRDLSTTHEDVSNISSSPSLGDFTVLHGNDMDSSLLVVEDKNAQDNVDTDVDNEVIEDSDKEGDASIILNPPSITTK
ncbi:hypothetical protein Cantr_02330 [Candida viswanathii]|uniref:Uncharacterized protein n=1 Tax=Candida viswanathii TaxID=5486 RepID=A0A367YLW5_9ASCO|nr:hypothetical protein Cantr_02330 [Candida viswanathii]